MGLIRLILIILVLYFSYKLVIKPLLRLLLQHAVRKVVDDQMRQFNGQRQQNTHQKSRPEGSINVDYIPEKDKKTSKKEDIEGEYIDYEEVK